MREILFRGKSEKFGNWIEGSLIVGRELESGQLEYLIAPLSAYYTEVKKVIPETIGQFTGLTDKNGTKIFEGDIVRNVQLYIYDDEIKLGIVCFCEGTFDDGCMKYNGWVSKGVDGDVDDTPLLTYGWFEAEVIGNIHDNPEFLGGE